MKQTLKNILEKMKYHSEGGSRVLLTFFIIAFLPVGVENIIQYSSDTSDYYKYDEEIPVEVIESKQGYPILLKSNTEFYKPIQVTWYDTLYCDGIKYPTQVWQDYKLPGIHVKQWEYNAYTPEGRKKECEVCGNVIGITTRGFEKTFNYCTDKFSID